MDSCHPVMGILYIKLFLICIEIKDFESAVKFLKSGLVLLKITHGEDNSLYKKYSETFTRLHSQYL